ncbi:MAG: cell envelope integrity protein TolA [Nitrospirae bacterium]|nr:cell envelope integrity protein TolA [Nitrospirota bacterium]
MREQGMYSAFTVSLSFHILLVLAAGIIVRHSNMYRMPSPYVVSLVDVSSTSGPAAGRQKETAQKIEEPPKKSSVKKAETPRVVEKPAKQDNTLVSDRIRALQAEKKIEKLVALRKVVDIGSRKNTSTAAASKPPAKSGKPGAGGTSSGAGSSGDYYSAIVGKIRQQWVYPESLDRDLEATVSIRIARDGSVTIDGIEKSSGSRLFDRSVLSAISKASPLPPPPQEMEIGVRFRP